jgi:hypothetical protein
MSSAYGWRMDRARMNYSICWIGAKGNGPVPGSNFQYSGWTTKANHLGNVAYRTGKKIEWDHDAMRAVNAPEADPFIKRPEYRKGWEGILKA